MKLKNKTAYEKKTKISLVLYDLENDICEFVDVSSEYPEVVERLSKLAVQIRKETGDGNLEGKNKQPPGFVDKKENNLTRYPLSGGLLQTSSVNASC